MLGALAVAALLAASDAPNAPATALAGFVTAEGSAPISAALWAELEAGLSTLPKTMRDFPGGPIELVLHREPAAFGMGDGTPERPEWSEGTKRFHLYRYVEADDRRAQWRLDKLSPQTRERLWRQRAAVHAVVARWDEVLKLSQRKSWRSLNGWLLPLERPMTFSTRALNLSVRAYSRARGQASPALDLATFAEERFVTAESFDAQALTNDDRVGCQEFSKTRVLAGLLAEHGLAPPFAPVECPAFEGWADLAHLSRFEVLLVQASGRRPESLFGHVLIRPVHAGGERVRGPSFAGVIQLAAVTDPVSGPTHLVRGLFGGYRLQVFSLSGRDVDRELLENDQRSIRRFAMALDKEQAKRVMQRAWELERRGVFNYQFLTDNCSTGLVWLLQGAFGESAQISVHSLAAASPAAVVDDLTSVTLNGAPLLKPIAPVMEATCERAERATEARASALREVREFVGAQDHAPFDRLVQGLLAPSTEQRAQTYERFAVLTRALPVAARPALFKAWAYTVWIERCAVDVATNALRELDLRTVLLEQLPPFDFQGEVEGREAMFEQESFLQRQLMVLDRAEIAQARFAGLRRRPLTPEEQQLKTRSLRTLMHFERLLALQGGLADTHFAAEDPQAFLDSDDASRSVQEVHTQANSQGPSGHWRARAGGGLWVDTQARPVLVLRSSALLEELGDQRLRGFQSGVALKVLDGETFIEPIKGVPRVLGARMTLFDIRSLIRVPALVRDSVLSQLGWGFALTTDYRRGRPLEARSGVSAELLAVGPRSPRFRAYLTAGVGASAFLAWGDRTLQPAAGPHGVVALRLPLGGANGLRAQGKYQLLATAVSGAPFVEELQTELSADFQAGPVIIAPQFFASLAREGGQARPLVWGSVLTFELVKP